MGCYYRNIRFEQFANKMVEGSCIEGGQVDQNHHIGTFIREKMDGFGFRQILLPKYLKGSIMLGFDGEALRGGLEGVAKRVKMAKMAVGM